MIIMKTAKAIVITIPTIFITWYSIFKLFDINFFSDLLSLFTEGTGYYRVLFSLAMILVAMSIIFIGAFLVKSDAPSKLFRFSFLIYVMISISLFGLLGSEVRKPSGIAQSLSNNSNIRTALTGKYVSVRPVIINDEYFAANRLIGGTVKYELTIPENGNFFKTKVIGSGTDDFIFVDSLFSPLKNNEFKLKEMERREIELNGDWYTGDTWSGKLVGDQIELTKTDSSDNHYQLTLQKVSIQ